MAKANSTKPIKPWKHQISGLWCITRKGRRYYLGKTESEARQRAKRYEKSIDRGLKIPELGNDRDDTPEPTVRNVLLLFLKAQKRRTENLELSTRSLSDYAKTCRNFTEFVGDDLWVTDLSPGHFMEYRDSVSKRRNLIGVGNEVTRVKTAFKWCYDYDAIEHPIKFGPEFRRPRKSGVKKRLTLL